MTIHGEKENCQIKYKGGAIIVLGAVFNSMGATHGWVPGFVTQFTFIFLYVPNCYNLNNCCQRQTSSPDFSNICNIVIRKQKARAVKGQEKLKDMYFALISASFSRRQIKNSLERNVRNCTLFLYWPVLTGYIQRSRWDTPVQRAS